MSKFFNDDIIEQVKNANDIVSVISEHIPLKKKGKNYWGCCPFHNEKTPSFSVTPEKGFFYCFGCRESGNVISFLMKYDNLTFPEAIERLATRANIALPERTVSSAERKRMARLESMYEVNELATNFFHNCLVKTELGKEGLDYLLKRGLSMETITKFRLGFAPDGWDKLYTAFTGRGVDSNVLLELGLCRKNEQGKIYDYFRKRVMFPIMDGKGRVLGFGGRVLDDSNPKYLNSPETEIFNKGHLLFAFYQSYRTIREKKQAVLVEGYMDVLSCHNVGITNVVASLGTAYTKDHGRLLMRQAEEVVLAYDMDGAGRTAAKRAIELLQNTEFSVKVVSMPDGKDPDDFIKNHGPQAWQELVDTSPRDFEFLLNESLSLHDTNSVEGKRAVLADIFPFIAGHESQVQRDEYLKALALPLWLDVSTIITYFRQFLRQGNIELKEQAIHMPKETFTDEEELLYWVGKDTDIYALVSQYIGVEDFTHPMYSAYYEKIGALVANGESLSDVLLEESLDAESWHMFGKWSVLIEREMNEELLHSLIRSVRLKSLRNQYKEHSRLADQLSRSNDPRFIEELRMCQDLQELIKQWS